MKINIKFFKEIVNLVIEFDKAMEQIKDIRGEQIMNNMVNKKSWDEFRKSGLLWWINMILHTFGWAICIDVVDGKATNAFPARVKFRGFDETNNNKGYYNVSEYLKTNINEIVEEAQLEDLE